MSKIQQNEFLGHIDISTDAIELIVGIAASKVKEVKFIQGNVDLLPKSLAPKGVQLITKEDGTYDVDIYVSLVYGASVPKVAKKIQTRVKEQVLYMCDITINQVNVFVTQLVSESGGKSEKN